MDERTCGIILRTRPLTETSLIVQWLSRDFGRISMVAKGARRAKSPFLGKLDLFYEAEFSFLRSRRSDLHTLREVIVRDAHEQLREEIAWLHQASYFAVLIEKATETDTPIAEIYELMQGALKALPESPPNGASVVLFELKLLTLLGYSPDPGGLSAAVRHGSQRSIEFEFADGVEVLRALSDTGKKEINRVLQREIGTVLERVPPQRQAALKSVAG